MKFFIAAPFGNYIRISGITSVMGTFTLNQRSGLILSLIRTLRYSFRDKAWYNALGLKNPGIQAGLRKWNNDSRNRVISIAAIENTDWIHLRNLIPSHVPLELNISCPNISKFNGYIKDLHVFAPRNPIIKLPPQILEHEVNELYKMGFRRFHSCNTLKTDKGARSGKILQEFVSNQIMHLKSLDANNFCIAGGGIEHPQDIHYYQTIGADGYSFGSVCFNLFKLNKLIQYVS
tara:strand:+ start:1073 stop:1771 length:699 start_codon:yes stop_codon:yes gene_type:complete